MQKVVCELYNDHFENAKRYQHGDNKNGESKLAGKSFFDTDDDFKINNFFDFCARLLKKAPKERGQAPAMIVFHSWQQREMVIQSAGSGSTLRAAIELNRKAYGFEIKKDFYRKAQSEMLSTFQTSLF